MRSLVGGLFSVLVFVSLATVARASGISGTLIIDGDQQLQASPLVLNASAKGTVKDPYVIQGATMSSPLGGFCLHIKNVTKVVHLKNLTCRVAEGGLRLEAVKNVVIENLDVSKVSGLFGVFPGGDGKDGIGVHLINVGKVTLNGKNEISYIYGGAGGAGAPGGGDAGQGGDAYAIFVEGNNSTLEINGLEVSFVYGGAGAAGGAGLISQAGGSGGKGGDAFFLALRGELKKLEINAPNVRRIYGGAGGAGAVGAVSGGDGGPGGLGGSANGVVSISEDKPISLILDSGEFRDLYGGAGAAGGAGAWGNMGNGGVGGTGGSGGSARVVALRGEQDDLQFLNTSIDGVFGGAGAAGGAGALGSMGHGGTGGNGGHGGHAIVVDFSQVQSFEFHRNQITKVLGAAGGAGALGGLGLWGRVAPRGKGGQGGLGTVANSASVDWDPDQNEVSIVKDGLSGWGG